MHVVVSREHYFEAAMHILATEGVGKLKIAHLCRSLNVTSGSFYGYFGNLQGFIEQFLTHWEATQTLQIGTVISVEPDPVLRIHSLRELGSRIPHDAEGAIRGWAHINDTVREFVDRVDREREDLLVTTLAPAVGRARAEKMAILGMTMLVGLQQWHHPVTPKTVEAVFSEFESLVLSGLPTGAGTAFGAP